MNILSFILLGSLLMTLAGCGSVETLDVPAPEAVHGLTDSSEFAVITTADPFPSSLTRLSANSKRDYTIYQGLHVIAQEGKKRGYRYFALTSPAILDNVSGSSITSPYEVFALCGSAGMREVLTSGSQCDGIRPNGIRSYYRAVFFREKPVDFVVWDIGRTLADPLVADTDISFDHEPLIVEDIYHIKHRGQKNK